MHSGSEPANNSSEDGLKSPTSSGWRMRLHEIIFEADTPAGKAFDVVLLILIVASVLVATLETVADIRTKWGEVLLLAEWVFTILFSIEYVLRLFCVARPWKYAISFYGLVDLLSILPTYLSIIFTGSQSLIVIRTLRLLRTFRVFKLVRYLHEAEALMIAIRATRAKITVFVVGLMSMLLILGSLMYLIEGSEAGFDSIPRGMYWAIVTVTTVGYGDIAPKTVLGQGIAALAMILGYCFIIVPTGVFSAEVIRARRGTEVSTAACPSCAADGHDVDAVFCKYCGSQL